MNFDEMSAITPTEYARDMFIERMLSMLGGDIYKVCDIGCGIGSLLAVIQGRYEEVLGIDTSDASLAIARNRITSPEIRLEKLNVFDLRIKFDLVFLTEVLEHIEDDLSFMKHIHDNVVRKNGYIIASVPAHKILYSQFDRNAGHYRRYCKGQIVDVFERAGFRVDCVWTYGRLIFHIFANSMLLFKGRDGRIDPIKDDMLYAKRTEVSAIREFTGISRLLVSRVNLLHKICFAIDCLSKNSGFGIEYCILSRSI